MKRFIHFAPQPPQRLVGDCTLCNIRHAFLYCQKCGILLQMMQKRGLYCPRCKETEPIVLVKQILCCTECDKPLAVTEGLGSYCLNCDFHPSMQDTFLWEIDKMPNPT